MNAGGHIASELSEAIDGIEFPRWTQLVIVGEPISTHRAKRVIFRTDPFLTDVFRFASKFHPCSDPPEFETWYSRLCLGDWGVEPWQHREAMALCAYVRNKIGFVDLNDIPTNYGPNPNSSGWHGFCHPNGEIGSNSAVKQLKGSTLLESVGSLARAFPDLRITVTAYDKSFSEDGVPALTLEVNGEVVVVDPMCLYERHQRMFEGITFGTPISIPMEWYREYAEVVRGHVEEFARTRCSIV